MLAGQLLAEPAARLVDAHAEEDRIRSREVDLLEDAETLGTDRRVGQRADRAVEPDSEDLPGSQLALDGNAEKVESAAFRSQDHTAFSPTQDQRAKAARIAG